MRGKNSIRIRISKNKKAEQVFKTVILHPMETGFRRDKNSGQPVPADYIEDFRIYIDGKNVFEIKFGRNVSKNPYLSFTF